MISEGKRLNLRIRPSHACLPHHPKLHGLLYQTLNTLPSDFAPCSLFDQADTFEDVGDVINPPILDLKSAGNFVQVDLLRGGFQ